MRGALDSEFLDAGRERDRAGDAGTRALDGVGNFAGRLVYDPEVISLEADSNTLSHTKNDCLLMVDKIPLPVFPKADADNSNCAPPCNNFFQEFCRLSRDFSMGTDFIQQFGDLGGTDPAALFSKVNQRTKKASVAGRLRKSGTADQAATASPT
jgi:hypothetical protein